MDQITSSDNPHFPITPNPSTSTLNDTEINELRRRRGRPRSRGRVSTTNDDNTISRTRRRRSSSSSMLSSAFVECVGHSSNDAPITNEQITNHSSLFSSGSISTINNIENPPQRRPRGCPRLRGGPSLITNNNRTDPSERRSTPSSSMVSSSFAPYLGRNSEHTSTNNDQSTYDSNRNCSGRSEINANVFTLDQPTPRMIVSSCTSIDIHGNPVHSTAVRNDFIPSSANSTRVPTTTTTQNLNIHHISDVDVHRLHRDMSSYWDCGNAKYKCVHYGAMMWYAERTIKKSFPSTLKFSLCCSEGKVTLPLIQHAPEPLRGLLDYNGGQRSKVFRQNIKMLNAMFSFTSTGGNINTSINVGGGPYTFCLNGHNHHRIGSLLPTHDDGRPRFAQLYVYDTENEVDNRFYALNRCISSSSDITVLRSLMQDLIIMLDQNNSLVKSFRMTRERFSVSSMQPVKLRLIGTRKKDGRQYNLPTASEVAALIPGDGNTTDSRDVLIEERGTHIITRISELFSSFMALQYPLLFPYGKDGYYVDIPLNITFGQSTRRKTISLREYYCFRLHVRRDEGKTLHKAGRLFHTYIVDAYSAVLEHDLDWYKRNQNTIRAELYYGLCDRLSTRDTSCESIGRWVVLPSSFTGGPRYMIQQYQDAMVVCRWTGSPDLFITMTCNPNWPEILRNVQETIPGQPTCDRHDIIAHMFNIKLDELMKDIRKKNHFGRVKAVIYTIEFQKRGLPHCHVLVFLHPDDKISSVNAIDKFISAELPSEKDGPCGFEAVRSHMMHEPCGQLTPSSPCMSKGRCLKRYPKKFCDQTFIRRDGWPCYRRSNNGSKAQVGRHDIMLDNQFVLPYNRDLVVKYGCHINVEWCNQGMLVKYLFSYINKGHDRATVLLEGDKGRTTFSSLLNVENEIEEYIICRYISTSESCWKLFVFEMRYRSIAVERLPFHEEDCNTVYFRDNDNVENVLERPTAVFSKFTEWMVANQLFPEGQSLTYTEFPTRFTWHENSKSWLPRKKGNAIGRIYYVSPSMGETFYLRMLLNVVRGPQSFTDIRIVDGVEHLTYMSACKALGLLGNDVEWVESIRDACEWQSGNQVRELFITILLFCMVNDQAKCFSDCLPYLSEDIVYNQRRLLDNDDVLFSEAEILNYTLLELEKILVGNNRSLTNFPNLPQISDHDVVVGRNKFIVAERTYDITEETFRFDELYSDLNTSQRDVYTAIMNVVIAKNGGFFFVSGCGGTGKTYLWRTLISSIRSQGKIVLSVASSGIASLLLPGGRTAHSRCHIPIAIDADSCCSITTDSELAELINIAELVIWDEASLQHRYGFEAVDRFFRDVCRTTIPDADLKVFGGKVVVLGGDFRQILHVVPSAPRSEIVASVVNRSPII